MVIWFIAGLIAWPLCLLFMLAIPIGGTLNGAILCINGQKQGKTK